MGAHGGGGGLAVGAGDAQGVRVVLHNRPPCLGTLIDGNATGHGTGNLRVAVVDGGGANHEVAVAQVLRIVADGHGDAQGAQVLHSVAVGHVGALDGQAHAPQYLGQGAHGHAADAHQMDALAGDQIITNGIRIVHHGNGLPFKNSFSHCGRRKSVV